VYGCSSEFCEKHLPLLFTILEKSNNAVVRANAVIALGDLMFRFPNLIEPWTSHIYARSFVFTHCALEMKNEFECLEYIDSLVME